MTNDNSNNSETLSDEAIHDELDRLELDEQKAAWGKVVCRGACSDERHLGTAIEESLASLGFTLATHVTDIAVELLRLLEEKMEQQHRATVLEVAALRAIVERERWAA
jgi:hypothetical protein